MLIAGQLRRNPHSSNVAREQGPRLRDPPCIGDLRGWGAVNERVGRFVWVGELIGGLSR